MKKIIIILLSLFWQCSNLYSQQCSVTNTNPPNGAVIYTLTPTLNWNITNTVNCSGCGSNGIYNWTTLRIATDSLMNNIIYTYVYFPVIAYSHNVPGGHLQYNIRYWWNVTFEVVAKCTQPCGNRFCNASSARWSFTPSITGIEKIGSEIPVYFSLYQNFPNPFNPSSTIKFDIAKLSDAKLVVYDFLGREVAALVNEQLQPGTYEVEWDATNYPSGIYFYKLITAEYSQSMKMILLK